ncbi:phosphate signaling complex protein PhoU [Methanosalsum natronophilum]|uniref:phosphate signaling complex protein PhoU n=1 Tax=Methanosalsum natronophilum TaxID=768733 RepID=UPI00216788A4|nr:phosphate signaling complex protein PhoU [Methanosalsum natronophilum]MCS3923011.1 phosphate transport system protein [Methanosalsum natronophilum]
MVRERYENELLKLKKKIVEMGDMSNEIIENGMRSFIDLDYELAKSTVAMDDLIDNKEMEVEASALRLIALQQPMAGDLRLITSCLKISLDLERMSDLAVNIAILSERIENSHIKPLIDTEKMGNIAYSMLKDSIIAFETSDIELAKQTAKKDEGIDKLFYSVWMELIEMMTSDCKEGSSIITNASNLLFVIRYLERIGDHACNICESVVYMVTGERTELN